MLAAILLVASPAQANPSIDNTAKLGSVLFADRNLSISRAQSCISCHSPNLAFTDPRTLGAVNGAVSRGADGRSFGDRNAPTLLYSALTPDFRFSSPAAGRRPNPETGQPWDDAEVALTIDREALARIPDLMDAEIDALVAFLGSLTDRRFEYLLAQE